ncbi:MAG: phytanoyl-CoA dioxygenase family protein [Actinomycetota bacterium]
MPKHLTDAQVDHFRQRGYLAPLDLLTPNEAAEARAKLEAYEAETGGPIGGAERAGGHLLWPWVDQLMRHETLLDAVEDLIGPDILCWNSVFWIKEAGSPSYVGWHQDLEYWGLDNDDLVNVWIALSNASDDAGAMSVIPGSHTELLDHDETYNADNMLTRGQELKIDVAEREVASMALDAGQMSMHSVRLAHGSGPNTTDDRRIGLSLQFMPTRTKQILVDWDFASLVRGTDDYGHFELAPRPEEDFDPVSVEFHQRAGLALRELLYKDAERPAERAPTL